MKTLFVRRPEATPGLPERAPGAPGPAPARDEAAGRHRQAEQRQRAIEAELAAVASERAAVAKTGAADAVDRIEALDARAGRLRLEAQVLNDSREARVRAMHAEAAANDREARAALDVRRAELIDAAEPFLSQIEELAGRVADLQASAELADEQCPRLFADLGTLARTVSWWRERHFPEIRRQAVEGRLLLDGSGR